MWEDPDEVPGSLLWPGPVLAIGTIFVSEPVDRFLCLYFFLYNSAFSRTKQISKTTITITKKKQ